MKRIKLLDETITYSSVKFFFVFLLKLDMVATARNRNVRSNHSCYTCIEPLIGYTDHSDSCKYLNTSSSLGLSHRKQCHSDDSTTEYECRKLVISYRSVETYLRRDCVPKGLCSWKDKAKSTSNIPILDCVYTDERTQKLECIYCCDTPLCNRTMSYRMTIQFTFCLLFLLVIKKLDFWLIK